MYKVQSLLIEDLKSAKQELASIACDKKIIEYSSKKAIFKIIKITGLELKKAIIIKQEMIRLGQDAIYHRETITGKIKKTDMILFGTVYHYQKLALKLRSQPFKLKELGQEILKTALLKEVKQKSLNFANGKKLKLNKPLIMGILNCTPDSFSDGGKYNNYEAALKYAYKMVKDGADIIDIGGQSSRPFAKIVSWQTEAKRIMPAIENIASKNIVSIDTYRANIAKSAIQKGASIINDITALNGDKKMVEIVASANCPVVLMHMQGNPLTMQIKPKYNDIISEIKAFFEERINFAINKGIKATNIILDPGIGFGKSTEHNLLILKNLDKFNELGFPLLIGVSNKSFIGNVLNLDLKDRLAANIAIAVFASLKKVSLIRVHDVLETKKALKMIENIVNI